MVTADELEKNIMKLAYPKAKKKSKKEEVKLILKGRVITPKNINKRQLQIGIEMEKEHTSSSRVAKKIAIDHLIEDARYYTKLKKAGL